MTNAKTDELWALTYAFANEAGICERSDKWHREEPCETCQGLVNYARRVVTVLTDAAVNWEASYHRACDDADAYKVETERRIAKIEQNWRSCQHEVEYLRAALVEHKKAKREASVSPPSEGAPGKTIQSDLLAWLTIEQRKAERWSYSQTGVYRFNLTGPELMRIRNALSASSGGEWQCRFVADDKRCCQLPIGHYGEHVLTLPAPPASAGTDK